MDYLIEPSRAPRPVPNFIKSESEPKFDAD
jgi:hypothetical protein